MTAQKGSSVLLKISNGGAPETFSAVQGLRTTRLLLNQDTRESSHLESGAWKNLRALSGLRELQITVAGIFMDSAQEEQIRAQAFAGSVLNYQLAFGNGNSITAPFMVVSYERIANINSPEEYVIRLESAGAAVFVD